MCVYIYGWVCYCLLLLILTVRNKYQATKDCRNNRIAIQKANLLMMFSRETGKKVTVGPSLWDTKAPTKRSQHTHVCKIGFGFGFMFGFSKMHRKREEDLQRKQITITRKCY